MASGGPCDDRDRTGSCRHMELPISALVVTMPKVRTGMFAMSRSTTVGSDAASDIFVPDGD